MGACLAACLDCRFLEGCTTRFVATPAGAGDAGLRVVSLSNLSSLGWDSEGESPRQSARSWPSSLGRILSPKNIRRDELELHGGETHKASNILDLWSVRGAKRPITDFYTHVKVLGEGAYGTVSKWRVNITDVSMASGAEKSSASHAANHVAVKQIKWQAVWHGFFRNRAAEQEIKNELKLLLILDNPFIIKFREWFEDPCNGIFFVMELCAGPSLQSILEDVCILSRYDDRRTYLQKLRRHFREVTYAVSYIHGLCPAVIHRDLKPDNVLLADNNEHSTARLIDFGLASLKKQDDYAVPALPVGTMVFMAPETFTNATPQLTEQTDVWALGIILTWILTAIELGSLQHPFLQREYGESFNVKWIDMYRAFKDGQPWNHSLLERGHPESEFIKAIEILDKVLVIDPLARCSASHILQAEWIRIADPAPSDAAELLKTGALLHNIKTFAKLSPFEKKILVLMADHAPDSKTALLRRTFRAFDRSNDGLIDCNELMAGLRQSGEEMEEQLIKAAFEAMDLDSSRQIGYQEWLAATLGPKILESECALSGCFRRLDAEDNGFITRHDVVRVAGEVAADQVFGPRENRFFEDECRLSFDDFKAIALEIGRKRAVTSTKKGSQSMVLAPVSISEPVRQRRSSVR